LVPKPADDEVWLQDSRRVVEGTVTDVSEPMAKLILEIHSRFFALSRSAIRRTISAAALPNGRRTLEALDRAIA
jgi:hypothetical protein